MARRIFIISCLVLLISPLAGQEQPATDLPIESEGSESTNPVSQSEPDDFGDLNLEDLMNVKVGTAAMPLRALKDVTAAVFVLSSEDIRRSGAKTVPDMLRMVPGLTVNQVDGNKYMISIRGFSSRFANKLQVLIDGRSIYSPTFSGVYWDQLGLTADEIDRIEVIRGSDGSLWGANAVNGIINIITKSSADTQGGYASQGFSTTDASDSFVRFGGENGKNTSFRLSARAKRTLKTENWIVTPFDQSESSWIGFRSDTRLNTKDTLTLGGSLYSAQLQTATIFPVPTGFFQQVREDTYPTSDFSLTGSLVSQQSKKDISEYRMSFSRNIRLAPEIEGDVSTFDIGYNRSKELTSTKVLSFGGSFRHVESKFKDSQIIQASDQNPSRSTLSTYGQLEQDLNSKVRLTLGTTFEVNPDTGIEIQPSARLLIRKDPTESIWFSASRAVRTPSLAETEANYLFANSIDTQSGLPVYVLGLPNKDFGSESVISLQAGWRKQATPNLHIDIAAFYNMYDNLRTLDLVENEVVMVPSPRINSKYKVGNSRSAITYGVELAANLRLTESWRFSGHVAYFEDKFSQNIATSLFPITWTDGDGSGPKWQGSLRSSWEIGEAWQFDVSGYFMSGMRGLGTSPSTRLDARLQFRPTDALQISIFGQNLFRKDFVDGTSTLAEVPTKMRSTIGFELGYRF
jgi:iron complex outermembrane receptor protein